MNPVSTPHLADLPGFKHIKTLPVLSVLDKLLRSLECSNSAVLKASPGAGKTTCVPLALLNAPWLHHRKILMLEPRRLAARGAAQRMSKLLDQEPGQTVGYRVRLESKISDATRIEVVTEGILTRMLQDDPSLEDYGVVIFDEFHERHLDADLGLSLTLKARQWFRSPQDGQDPLKLLVMSATLDNNRIIDLLETEEEPAPLVESEGRQHPVTIEYVGRYQSDSPLMAPVLSCIHKALDRHSGSILVFLPGVSEIRACQKALQQKDSLGSDTIIAVLHGNLSLKEQSQAVRPCPEGRRKVVLATPIAESSLTIEGISVVIDSGLVRVPRFDPNTGMTRLHTCRISRASSEQRAGRAGRLSDGYCYRLWSESQQAALIPYPEPEIAQADLAGLALSLNNWGVERPEELEWLDSPPVGAYSQAISLLQKLKAMAPDSTRLTEHGQAMATFPAHPRLAHMLLVANTFGLQQSASRLAALLSERDIFDIEQSRLAGADIALRLSALAGGSRDRKHSSSLKRVQDLASQFAQGLSRLSNHIEGADPAFSGDQITGLLLACAYPDRIARRRGAGSSDYLMANGRAARLDEHDPLISEEWLVCAHLTGTTGGRSDTIRLAAGLDPTLFSCAPLDAQIEERGRVEWDAEQERFVAEQIQWLGEIVVSRHMLKQIDPTAKRQALIELVRKRGLELLPWTPKLENWRARVRCLREAVPESGQGLDWPDLSDQALLSDLDQWLGPFLDPIKQLRDFEALDLDAALKTLLPWPLPRIMDELAPETIQVPSGSRIRIDYCQQPPVLAVRLQEMLGCATTPVVCQGKVALMLHLLSPAQRPLAVTSDLASFWQNAYPEVKKEMKGRYPKHFWPDEPLSAEATRHVKARM